jgi:hypothetical protein
MQKAYYDRNTGMWHILKEKPHQLVTIGVIAIDFHNIIDARILQWHGTPFIFFDDDVDCEIGGEVGHRFAVCRKREG